MHTERQGHGFAFEDYVEDIYNVDRSHEGYGKKYTDPWDGLYYGYPVSIKHIKKGCAVDLADVFRQASITEDFIMFVDFYETPLVSETDDIHILFIPGEKWHSYFASPDIFEERLRDVLKSVSNDKSDDAKWTKLRVESVKFWKSITTGFITLNGKRDHEKQKRWQCSINNTNFFKEFLPKYEITEEEFYAKRNEK